LKPVYYTSYQNRLTDLVYYNTKEEINQEHFRFAGEDVTFFINDNLYIEELAKIIAFGARRVIVNGIFVNDLNALKRELDRLDGFAVIAGFGEIVSPRVFLKAAEHNVFWSKHGLLLSDTIQFLEHHVYEHPFWGISGDYKKKNELVGNLDYNREVFEFYLKNIEHK
jgi:hypothetical protein